MEAAQLAPSRESVPVDVWNAAFARKSKHKKVPLIPLALLGIHHDQDGMLSSEFLVELPSGAEVNPFRDDDWNVVYKFFFGAKEHPWEKRSNWKNQKLTISRLAFILRGCSILSKNYQSSMKLAVILQRLSVYPSTPIS
jgi:hypothetical protein